MKVVNGIKPVYLEATGRILEEAERVFEKVSHDSLLPLADHIALAAKRAEEKMQIPNPFTPDIKVLFEKEYKVALKGREIIREMTGAEISDDEVGFISLHIHSARSDEKVSETLDNTRLINEGIRMIEEYFQIDLEQDSLGYNRMMSHIYYMLVRTRKGEQVKADLNDFVQVKYPKEFAAAEKICAWIEQELKKEVQLYLDAVKLAPEKVRAFLDAILTRTRQTRHHDQPSHRKSQDVEL